MNIIEYQPYIDVCASIVEYENKKASIEAEIIQVRLDQSMPVLPTPIPEGATPEEILEIYAKNDPAYIPSV